MKKGFLVISDNRVIIKIPVTEIVHVESKGMRSSILTSSGERLGCSRNLGCLCKELDKTGLIVRVHTSHAVNLDKIKKVQKERKGFIFMQNGTIVPIAKRRKAEFFKRFLSLVPGSQE